MSHSAWVEKIGSKYYISWYGPKGRRRKMIGRDCKAAEIAKTQKVVELNSGTRPQRDAVTFSAFVHDYLEVVRTKLQPSTVEESERVLYRFSEYIGPQMMITDVSAADAEGYMAKRVKDRLATPSVNKEFRALKAALGNAVTWGYLLQNPLKGVKQWREDHREIRVLDTVEVERLLASAPSLTWQAFICTALTSGLRKSELVYLEWTDVDVAAGLIHVRSKPENHVKSGKDRSVGLVARTAQLLHALRQEQAGRGIISRWVFTTRNGAPLANNNNKRFKEIVEKAQIAHCTIHDLRRTFCSQLAMAGVSAPVVQKAAGHASIATTQKHYIGIDHAALKDAADRLPFAGVELKRGIA